MKVAIYARVSDDKKKQDGERRQDIERQVSMLKEYYKGKDVELTIYKDDGKSAFTDDLNQRPAFKQLLNDCRRNFVQEILVEDLTRFSRNLSLGLQWLSELARLNVNLISMREGEIEATSSAGWLKSTIVLMFAEWDSRIKSEKVKSGMKKAKNLGKKVGGFRIRKEVKVGSKPIDFPIRTEGLDKVSPKGVNE